MKISYTKIFIQDQTNRAVIYVNHTKIFLHENFYHEAFLHKSKANYSNFYHTVQ